MFSFIVGHSQSSHVGKKRLESVYTNTKPVLSSTYVISKNATAPDKQLHLNKYTEVNNGKSHGGSRSQHEQKQKQDPMTVVRRLWAPVVVYEKI